MSAFRAGVLTLVVILVAAYFGFTKANPFANPFELKAVVRDAQNLKSGAPVRSAISTKPAPSAPRRPGRTHPGSGRAVVVRLLRSG